MVTVSQMDEEFLRSGRAHISRFLERTAARLSTASGRLLEVGPQDCSGISESFRNNTMDTFDIRDAPGHDLFPAARQGAVEKRQTQVLRRRRPGIPFH
jgi:hypothetical protein